MNAQKKEDIQIQKSETRPAQVEMTRDLPVSIPAADIHEYPDRIIVLCDMPGVDPKDVDITLEDDVLTLTGVAGSPDPDGGELLYRGFQPGLFRRAFTITADVDRGGIHAKSSHGVLTVELPKAAEARPRKIPVNAG